MIKFTNLTRWMCTTAISLPMLGWPLVALPQTKPPIKVGAISSTQFFPESAAAVRAYFDVINANGGIQGRQIRLITEDDRGDAAAAKQSAKRLVEVEGVVANVGSASTLECAVNAPYYAAQKLVSIQGTGVDPACFNSANISPVNAGPYLSTALALQFLSDVRKVDKLCVFATSYSPIQTPVYAKEIAAWSARSGKPLALSVVGMTPDQNLEEKVSEAVKAGCTGVVYTGVEAHVLEWMAAVERLKVQGGSWVFLTPAYTANVAKLLGPAGNGIFAMSEFEPWTSRSGMLNDWRDVMTRGKVPRTSFSQGGYIAALLFVRALRSIEGDINRESVTRAFKALTPQKVSMLGTAYEFGPGDAHASNRANVPVQLQDGNWRIAHWDFIVAPPAAR